MANNTLNVTKDRGDPLSVLPDVRRVEKASKFNRLTSNKEECVMSKEEPHRNRSAISGRFVNDAAAARWPKNTVRETPKPSKPCNSNSNKPKGK